MKKVFKNSSEVCHIFASQSQSEGRCANVYFNDNLIYSYGRHFCMAKLLPGNRAIITNRNYSVTTSKHLSQIRYALNHFERIYVPYPEGNFQDNLQKWVNEFTDLYNTIGNKRKKAETIERAKIELKSLVSNIDTYLQWTGQKMKAIDLELLKKFKTYHKAAKEEKTSEEIGKKLAEQAIKAIKKRQKEQKESLTKWINGEQIETWFFNSIDKVYLRMVSNEDGDFIQTSKGAEITLKAGKVLFELMKAGKDIKGIILDDRYTVISLNGVLTIGCHKIERSEINRFAGLMGWGSIELH